MNNLKIIWQKFGRTFVAIDAANLEHSAKDMKMHVRYQQLLDFFKQHTGLIQINFYSARFGSKSHNRFLTFLNRQGYKLITKPIKTITDRDKGERRKADFDVEITADAMNILEKFDTLVLFSGDSDFDYLIKLLKSKNKKVIVISSKHHVAKELILSCTKYFDLRKFRDVFLFRSFLK